MAHSGLQEAANGARGGHPRTAPYSKMSSKGHTELQISLSRATQVEEAAGDIRFRVCLQKKSKNAEKSIFSSKFSKFFESVRTHPNASRCICIHPNASRCIRTGPNKSEQVRKPRKTRENHQRFGKFFAKACSFCHVFWSRRLRIMGPRGRIHQM